jgi:DNA topoisomerase IB
MRETADEKAISEPVAVAMEISAAARLRYISDSEPGISRKRRGKRFAYYGPDGRRVIVKAEIERIAALAIPPAYRDVWICVHPRGHLQATGRDARRRKQYRYHADWRAICDDVKFERMVEFGEALTRLRRKLRSDLKLPGLPRDKVLAVIVTLLDTTRARIGNAEYARDNKSFGLTTLRNSHAHFVREGRVRLQFTGKGGVAHDIVVNDRRLAHIVRRCHQLPGQALFQYVDDAGAARSVDSTLVNDYLRTATGAEFTAKDFRTWSATVHAIELLADRPRPERPTESACKRIIVDVVKDVARSLRNTPAVCRKSYINPIVFTEWQAGRLRRFASGYRYRHQPEKLALAFLKHARR